MKHRYGLWVTPAERDTMARILADCPHEPALTSAYAAKATFREELVTSPSSSRRPPSRIRALPVGQTQVTTAGQNGERTLTYRITVVDGEEISRQLASDEITTPAIAQVTAIGTYVAPAPVVKPAPAPAPPASNCDSNYADACVPISSDVIAPAEAETDPHTSVA